MGRPGFTASQYGVDCALIRLDVMEEEEGLEEEEMKNGREL